MEKEEKEKIINEENESSEKKEEIITRTDFDQNKVEQLVLKLFEEAGFDTKKSEEYKGEAKYYRLAHYNFTKNLINTLPAGYSSLDSGFPWFTYWISNIILMCKDNYDLSHDMKMQFVQVLKELQHEDGGFRGSPRGYAHLIATYAAMMTIANLGIPEAYDIVDIPKMKNFLLKMKNNNFDVDKKPSY